MPSAIVPSEALDKKLLDYILLVTERARGWWSRDIEGTSLTRKDELLEYRLRMEGRRSVAGLYHDAKNEPFAGASSIGVGIEAIFSEYLIPLLLANTHDLEPMLQALQRGTKTVSEDLTTFHDQYHRYDVPLKRELLEYSLRDLLTVGSCFHKWPYQTLWRQTAAEVPVWQVPDGSPLMTLDQGTGQLMPQPADPKTPPERWPRDPQTGQPLQVMKLKGVDQTLRREGPELVVRPVEAIGWPERETRTDPDLWEWLSDDFDVSPYWFLGREGEPFHGKLKLAKLWAALGLDPHTVHKDPLKLAAQSQPIKLRAWHGQFPAAADGAPVEVVALLAVDQKLLLGWQPSSFPRRPYMNRQVWHSGTSPLGRGIPETVFSLRSAMDALLNQDIDAGNLYNHPPLLLSDLAMLEDEDYESTGPGATWVLRDINGAKFLPTPPGRRDPVALLDWLIVNTMRLWGVTDLSLNSPTNRLSSAPETLGGTQLVLNQGNIKFGHLTKRLAAVDSVEYQFIHESFARMLVNPKRVVVEGRPVELPAAQRAEYFTDAAQLVAVGNGISTNPLLRQQTYSQFLSAAAAMQNPFLIGDLEAYKTLTEQWAAAYGVDVQIKDPQALEQSRLFLELMQTPEGQQALPAAMTMTIQAIQAKQLMPGGAPSNGRAPVRR